MISRKLPFLLIVVTITTIAIATVVENIYGTKDAYEYIYGSLWFIGLWAILTMSSIYQIIKHKLYYKPVLLGLHLSFVVILLGAATTHFTSINGTIHLAQGATSDKIILSDGSTKELPFNVTLQSFHVKESPETSRAIDYISNIEINGKSYKISMNHIATYDGWRFYQKNYTSEENSSTLDVCHDSWGIWITYTGYGLLFVLFIIYAVMQTVSSRREISRNNRSQKRKSITFYILLSTMVIVTLIGALFLILNYSENEKISDNENSNNITLSKSESHQLGRLYMDMNGRISIVETYARDFTHQLCGSYEYNGYDANQVLSGFVINPDKWIMEPIIQIKDKEIREKFNLSEMSSYVDLFDMSGNYKFAPYWNELNSTMQPKGILKKISKIDDKIAVIQQVLEGKALKIFPNKANGTLKWITSSDMVDGESEEESFFRNNIFKYIALQHNTNQDGVEIALEKIKKYQIKKADGQLPSPQTTNAEIALNKLFKPILLIILLMIMSICGLLSAITHRLCGFMRKAGAIGLSIGFIYLSISLILRSMVSGNIPMTNGYETMLFMSWCILGIGLFNVVKLRNDDNYASFLIPISMLGSALCIIVSNMSYMNPAITPVPPVLSSSLLTIHVSIIMLAYALLSIIFLLSLIGLCVRRNDISLMKQNKRILLVALCLLSIGIFVGAIWANQSWGSYWNWDPKEAWALITLLVYCIPIHENVFSGFKKPITYNVYIAVAFVAVLITFFGVNYILGGMHSYA